MLEWFNGKKTLIGAVLLFSAAVIDQVAIGIMVDKYRLFASPPWLPASGEALTWFGMFVTGTGFVHKGVKAKNGKDV